jgi:stringent starvation protein B
MPELSTKPYLIRAIHDWCTDSGFTPYIAVAVDDSVRVPMDFVKNGEIVLNVSALATNHLKIGNDAIEFQARFGGVPREVHVPIDRVIAVYARENGQGMAFDVPRAAAPAGAESERPAPRPPALTAVAPAPAAAPAAGAGNETPPPASPPPAGGDRPKLTRIK